MKISVTIDDVRLKSNLKIIQTLIFTENTFFYIILGFTRSRCYPLDDIDVFHQLIAGSFKSDRPINVIGINKVRLKADCIQGGTVNGVCEAFLYSSAIDQPTGHEIFKATRVKLPEKINRAVLSHITIYSENDDYKAVNFNGEAISFTCQLVKI